MLFDALAEFNLVAKIVDALTIPMWIFDPIDSSRPHLIDDVTRWHARLMSLGWSFFFPVAIIAARFFKVTPQQRFPEQIDNQWWWDMHRICVALGTVAVAAAFCFIYFASNGGVVASSPHQYAGWTALALMFVQIFGGLLRGTRGGPKMPRYTGAFRGDHFDMTTRRIVFERIHKSIGYIALATAWFATVAGLWSVNAPIWIWLLVIVWWAVLCAFAIRLQRQGRAIDTYQAIWGTHPTLIGNQRASVGKGVRRVKHRDQQ